MSSWAASVIPACRCVTPARIAAMPSWAWLGWYSLLVEGGRTGGAAAWQEGEVRERAAHLYPCSSLRA